MKNHDFRWIILDLSDFPWIDLTSSDFLCKRSISALDTPHHRADGLDGDDEAKKYDFWLPYTCGLIPTTLRQRILQTP